MTYDLILTIHIQVVSAFGESNKHTNGLLLDIDYLCTSCKYIWDDKMSIRS